MSELRGAVVIVAGADSAIGASVASALSHRAATVVLVGRDKEALHRAAERCESRTVVIGCDLSVLPGYLGLILQALRETSRIDAWVHCVEEAPETLPTLATETRLHAAVSVAATPVSLAIQQLLPVWSIEGAGHFVLVAPKMSESLRSAPSSLRRAAAQFTRTLFDGFREELASAAPGVTLSLVEFEVGLAVDESAIRAPSGVAGQVVELVASRTAARIGY